MFTVTGGVAMDVRWINIDFEDLYREEYPNLLAVATALTGSRLDGEDVVQDTMVRAFVHWPRVRLLERPGGWCHHVLTNLCRSRWRRRTVERRWVARQQHRVPWFETDPADVVAFWSVVRTLPQRPRTVVALYYAADRPTAEIATILGVPEGTVRSDLLRAREVLSRELGF
jgi:RNA polymerase sigma factor (sigma-70 family)